MKTVHKSVLLWHSAADMFALVTDIPRYPEFLPWCDHAKVLETHPDGVVAEVGIALAGFKKAFVTRNTHVLNQRVDMKLVQGPFSQLEGHWLFTPLGGPERHACQIDFELRYSFDNMALAALIGPVFDKIAGGFVDAFVKRADQLHPQDAPR